MTKTEAKILNQLTGGLYGGQHIPESVSLLSKREIAQRRSLEAAGVVIFHEPTGDQPSTCYPRVSMPWLGRALDMAKRVGAMAPKEAIDDAARRSLP